MNEIKRGVCRVCINSDGKICKVKKVKTAQNKKRVCSSFEQDITKIRIKKRPKSEYVPYHMTSRKLYKKWLEDQTEKELKESMEQKIEAVSNPDILSKFRSTAS